MPRSNDVHKWKYRHHEQDISSHGGANEGYKHSTAKAWRNTWPTSRGCFWQAKRKKESYCQRHPQKDKGIWWNSHVIVGDPWNLI